MRYILIALATILNLALAACGDSQTTTTPTKITIITPLSHPSLASTIDGFRAGLADKGYAGDKVQVTVENALGDFSRVTLIARSAIENGAKLVFVLTTPASAAAIQVTNPAKIPLIYSAVTDPVAAGVVSSMSGSTSYATGVSDRYDVTKQVRFFKEIMPALRTVAILYSAGEQNSIILGDETVQQSKAVGITPNVYVVEDVSRFPLVAKQAFDANDAMIINGDNKLVQSLSVAINLAVNYKKPLFVGDPDSVRKGALATVGPSYFAIGRRAGFKAAEVLAGKDVRKIPSENPSGFEYVVNMEAARNMGVTIPAEVWASRSLWQSTDQ